MEFKMKILYVAIYNCLIPVKFIINIPHMCTYGYTEIDTDRYIDVNAFIFFSGKLVVKHSPAQFCIIT